MPARVRAEAEEAAPPLGARLGALFASPAGRWLRRLAIGAFAFLAVSLVVRQARAAVHRMPAYRLGPDSVRFVDLSPSVDATMRAHLVGALPSLFRGGPGTHPSTFDQGAESRLREILGAHPMLRTVGDVEVRYPAEVRVRAEVRTPLARFRARIGTAPDGRVATYDLPIDGEGYVLYPTTYAAFLERYRTVLVTGVAAACPEIGRRWSDSREQVAEGLAAARVANRLNQELSLLVGVEVKEVDVSAFPAAPKDRRQGEVLLRLSDGRVVQWGRTERSLSEVVREDGYEAKKTRLLDLLAAPAAGPVLDVRFPPTPRRGTGP